MIEKEYKYLISKGKYANLLRFAKEKFSLLANNMQVNYYYDDDYFTLHRNGVTLRVRQVGDALELHEKSRLGLKNHLHISDESKKIVRSLPYIIDGRYCLKGSLTTNRHSFILDENHRLDLDENVYLGTTDFEAEIETALEDDDTGLAFIRLLGLTSFHHADGKSSRFFNKLTSHGGTALEMEGISFEK